MDGMVNSLLLDGPDVYVLEVVMMLVPLRRRVLREVGGLDLLVVGRHLESCGQWSCLAEREPDGSATGVSEGNPAQRSSGGSVLLSS